MDCLVLPVIASQVKSSHSHSIVNEPFILININGLAIDVDGNTMKYTMFRNCC